MGTSQRIYSPNDRYATSSLVPCQMRQKLYDLSLNLHMYVFDKNIMNILEEEVERMFTSVDELEKVMHKLDTQIAELDDDDLLMTSVSLTDVNYMDETFEVDEDINNVYPKFGGLNVRASSTNSDFNEFNIYPNSCCIKNDAEFNMMEDELNVIYQEVVFLTKWMDENMERLERIMKKLMISGPQPQNRD